MERELTGGFSLDCLHRYVVVFMIFYGNKKIKNSVNNMKKNKRMKALAMYL